jgi:hypothetical protein
VLPATIACNLTVCPESTVSNPQSFSPTEYVVPSTSVAANAQRSVFDVLVVKASGEDVWPLPSPARSIFSVPKSVVQCFAVPLVMFCPNWFVKVKSPPQVEPGASSDIAVLLTCYYWWVIDLGAGWGIFVANVPKDECASSREWIEE